MYALQQNNNISFMACLEVKKWKGSSSITLFGSFLKNEGEGFGGFQLPLTPHF